MSARIATRIAWGAAALSIALGIGSFSLNQWATRGTSGGVVGGWFVIAWTLTFSVIGALIVSRQPKNMFGWVLTLVTVLVTLDLAASTHRGGHHDS